MSEKEDIASNPIYRLIARYSLREMHDCLLKSLSGSLSQKDGKRTLVIVGHGPEVVPFSRNLDIVEEMVGEGNIGMIDYNSNIRASSIDALVNPRFDPDENVPEKKRKGIKDRGYDFVDIPAEQTVDLRDIGSRKISVRQGDLSQRLRFADSSVSALDATLVEHHVTAYKQGLVDLVREVHRVLEQDGMFHLGTGVVDMRYQEEKIHRVALEAKRFYQADVALEDKRDPNTNANNVIARAFYSAILEYVHVPLVKQKDYERKTAGSDSPVKIQIRKEGMIEVDAGKRNSEKFRQYLLSKGFKQVYSEKEYVVLPIIDPGMQEDRDLFLESVRNYYRNIMGLNAEVFADRPDIAAKVLAAENKEFGDSSRGLMEYYTHPRIIMSVLQDNGFRDIRLKEDSRQIWCNITAVK